MTIFVGNLNEQVTEYQLRALFSEFGEVKSAKIISDNYTGLTKGCGLVQMWKRQQGEEAVANLNNSILYGQGMVVKEVFIENRKPPGNNISMSPKEIDPAIYPNVQKVSILS